MGKLINQPDLLHLRMMALLNLNYLLLLLTGKIPKTNFSDKSEFSITLTVKGPFQLLLY